MLAQSTTIQTEATPTAALKAKAESLAPSISRDERASTYAALEAAIVTANGVLTAEVLAALEVHADAAARYCFQGLCAVGEVSPGWARLRGDFVGAWGLREGSCPFTDDVVTGDLDVAAGKALHDEHEERFEDLLEQVLAHRPATVLDASDKALLLHLTPEFDQSGLDVIASDLALLAPAASPRFESAFGAWERAAIENAALYLASADAAKALEAAYPTPDSLERPHDRGLYYLTEGSIQEAQVPFDRKVDLITTLRGWRIARDASAEKVVVERAEASSSAGYEHAWSTFRALMSSQPASAAQLLRKMEVLLKETVLERSVLTMTAPLAADDIAELISSEPNDTDAYEKRMLLEFYFDLCRINGTPSPLEQVRPFDPVAWTEKFEALPGHKIDERGAVFHEPEAWSPDYLTDEDFRVTDPDEIEAYWRAVESYCPESVAERATQFPDYRGRPFIAGSLRAYEFIYGEGDPRLVEKAALFERRHEQSKQDPIGKHLWAALAGWQQKMVREFAKDRDKRAGGPQLLAAE